MYIKLIFFIDINECKGLRSEHGCDVNAYCNDNHGSYECICKPGFYGNGFNCTGKLK